MSMIAALLRSTLLLSHADAAAAPTQPEPPERAIVDPPTSVKDALGVTRARPLRQVGVASLATGVLLEVVAAGAFAAGFEAERVLRSEPHTREAVDALLWQRTAAAAVAYPAVVLGMASVAAGITCLLLNDTRGGLSDGQKEVVP